MAWSLEEESRGGHGNAAGRLHRDSLTVLWRSGGLTTPLHFIFQEIGLASIVRVLIFPESHDLQVTALMFHNADVFNPPQTLSARATDPIYR